MISRAPGGGIINYSKVSNGFQKAAHQTFGAGSKTSPLVSSKIIDRHMYSPKPGRIVDYSLSHTEINPYKAGGIAVGGAAVGYGAYKGVKWAKTHPDKFKISMSSTNKAIGGHYARHARGMDQFHTGAAVASLAMPLGRKQFWGYHGLNVTTATYGAIQAEKVSGKTWPELKRKRR